MQGDKYELKTRALFVIPASVNDFVYTSSLFIIAVILF